MVRRKQCILNPLSVFKIYYKIQSIYAPKEYSVFIWKKTKEIKNTDVINNLEYFLDKYRYSIFEDSITKVEEYFTFCFMNNHSIYFNNLGDYISEWKKEKLENNSQEIKYLFANQIIDFLKSRRISFKQYLLKQKGYIPIILQHYLATKEIPFEVALYLKSLDKCDIDKKKMKVLFSKEYYEILKYEKRTEQLKTLIESELKKILEWEKSLDKKNNL